MTAEHPQPSTHRTLADYFAGIPRQVQAPPARPSALEYWARDVAGFLATDKSNDWTEELDRLADILNDEELRAKR